MNTNCAQIETLLPAFVERTLGADDAAMVASHVGSCAACAESLAAFAALEGALVMRRAEVPPVDALLPRIAPARAVPSLAHSPVVKVFRTVMSLPGISILLTMWAAMFALSFRTDLARDLARYSSLERWQAMVAFFTQQLTVLVGDNVWTMAVTYLALTLVILGSVGAMALRYTRR